jgi:hypothetical protein
LHSRNGGRVADRQTEAKAQPERDIGFPNPPDRARCNERSTGEQRACAGYPVRADPIGQGAREETARIKERHRTAEDERDGPRACLELAS